MIVVSRQGPEERRRDAEICPASGKQSGLSREIRICKSFHILACDIQSVEQAVTEDYFYTVSRQLV